MIMRRITSALLTTTILSQSIIPIFSMEQTEHVLVSRSVQTPQELWNEAGLLSINPCFKECESFSPLYGLLALKSGILRNARFYGFYDAHDPQFLTHYSIAHPHDHESTLDRDSPLDYTSAVLQQFFPSPAGGVLMIPGSKNDFFKCVPLNRLGELLMLYIQEKHNFQKFNIPPSEARFEDFFADCFGLKKKPTKHAVSQRQRKLVTQEKQLLKKEEKTALKKRWGSDCLSDQMLYSNLFVQSISATEEASLPWIEQAVNALISQNIPLNHYQSWAMNAFDEKGKVKAQAFDDLLQTPEELTFMILMHDDFFKKIPVDLLEELRELYLEGKRKFLATGELPSRDTFTTFFKKCFSVVREMKRNKNETVEKWSFNRDKRDDFQSLWNIDIDLLKTKFATIFSQSIFEAHKYPHNIIESGLMALVCKRMNLVTAKPEDFSKFVDPLIPFQNKRLSLNASRFTKDYYESWKLESLDEKKKLKQEAFEVFLENPEDLIFMTLMYDVYDNPFPQILGTSDAIHTYVSPESGTVQKETFPDCGETSLRNFFNLIFRYTQSRTFNLQAFKNKFPNASKKLISFYEVDPGDPQKFTQSAFEAVHDGIEGRSAWADVVSSLNTPDDPRPVDYRQADGRCNISGVGLDNMLLVLEKILGEPVSQVALDEEDINKRRAKQFTFLLNKLSGTEEDEESVETNSANSQSSSASDESDSYSEEMPDLSWHINGESESLPNFCQINIQLEEEDYFTWHFNERHFQFERSATNPDQDWRHLSPEQLHQLLKSPLSETLKAHLIPFYLGENDNFDLFSDHGYMNDMLFGSNLGGAEQQFKIMDKLIPFKTERMKQLFPLWLKRMPEDEGISRRMLSFLFKHQQFFTEEVLATAGGRIVNLYKNMLQNLEENMTCEVFKNYLWIDYSEDLLIHFLHNCDIKKFTLLKDEEGHTPLYHACFKESKSISLIKTLLKRGANVNALQSDYTGGTVLHALMMPPMRTDISVPKLLLKYGADIHAHDQFGSTPFKFYFPEDLIDYLPEDVLMNYLSQHPDGAAAVTTLKHCLPQFDSAPELAYKFKPYFSTNCWYTLAKDHPNYLPSTSVFRSLFELTDNNITQLFSKFSAIDQVWDPNTQTTNNIWSGITLVKLMDIDPSLFGKLINSPLAKQWEPAIINYLLNTVKLQPERFMETHWLMTFLRNDGTVFDMIINSIMPGSVDYNSILETISTCPPLFESFGTHLSKGGRQNLLIHYIVYYGELDNIQTSPLMQSLLFSGNDILDLIKENILSHHSSYRHNVIQLLNAFPDLQTRFKNGLSHEDRTNILSSVINFPYGEEMLQELISSSLLQNILFDNKEVVTIQLDDWSYLDRALQLWNKAPATRYRFKIQTKSFDSIYLSRALDEDATFNEIISCPLLQEMLYERDDIWAFIKENICSLSDKERIFYLLRIFPDLQRRFKNCLTPEDRTDILSSIINFPYGEEMIQELISSPLLQNILFDNKDVFTIQLNDWSYLDRALHLWAQLPITQNRFNIEVKPNDLEYLSNKIYEDKSIEEIISCTLLQNILFSGDEICQLLKSDLFYGNQNKVEFLEKFPDLQSRLDSYLSAHGHYEPLHCIENSVNSYGSINSANYLGIIYQYGLGVQKDDQKALKWYTISADQGDEFAQKQITQIQEK